MQTLHEYCKWKQDNHSTQTSMNDATPQGHSSSDDESKDDESKDKHIPD